LQRNWIALSEHLEVAGDTGILGSALQRAEPGSASILKILVKLFDVYLNAGTRGRACDTLERFLWISTRTPPEPAAVSNAARESDENFLQSISGRMAKSTVTRTPQARPPVSTVVERPRRRSKARGSEAKQRQALEI